MAHVPLFVPSYGAKVRKSIVNRDFKRDPPTIVSTGFIRPHKGLPQLIEALAIVKRTYPGAKLRLQCAFHTSSDSRQE